MTKPKAVTGKKIWPVERKLINRIITKQKGYHNKPYPAKNKIPTEALHSVAGALNVLDKAEKKKPNKGHIVKYRKGYEHTQALPEAHYMSYKATPKKPKKRKPLTAAEKEARREARLAKDKTYRPSAATIARQAETKEQRSARLQKALEEARKRFLNPTDLPGPTDLKSVIKQHVSSQIPKNFFQENSHAYQNYS